MKALRPRQWVKNVLVLAAPMAAGTDVLTDGATMLRVLIAFVAFCLIASATYLINDALDVEADRNHPTKRFRPIAAGVVPQKLAFVLAAVLALAAIGISFLANWQTAVTIAVYFAIQLGYCFGLKHQAVIDICIVSSGFFDPGHRRWCGRAAAEGLSRWFLLVMAFDRCSWRPANATPNSCTPSEPAPRSASRWSTIPLPTCGSCGRCRRRRWCSATACGRWTPAPAVATATTSYSISIVLFTVAILRYAVDVDGRCRGRTRRDRLGDRILQFWRLPGFICVGVAVYATRDETRRSEKTAPPAASLCRPVRRRRGSRHRGDRPHQGAGRTAVVSAVSFAVGAIGVTVFFAIGAWQRRWIADDGLIVLRTLRNLFAGNGPVFNAGERVEANTSTAWTYLLWFWAWITDGQLEYVALWVALVLSVTAIPLTMYGTARLYADRIGRDRSSAAPGWTLLLPLGAIVYIAVPPARDFATSGLENGLCIFWIAALWCQFVAWGRRGRSSEARGYSQRLGTHQ